MNSNLNATPEIKNAKQMPRTFMARHMQAGIAQYNDGKYWVDTDAMKRMSATFKGKPVYVEHQQVNVHNLQEEADGYVMNCFYNEFDGHLWSEILIVSDKGHRAVDEGQSVSNAYIPKNVMGGGKHLNVDYDKKILDADFTHLAIVRNPRYESSKIMSLEDFKKYQESKKQELEELRNSNDNKEKSIMLKFFRTKEEEVTNAADVLETDFTVLSDGTKITVKELLNSKEALEKHNAEKEAKKSKKYKGKDGKEYNLEELENSHAEYERIKKEMCAKEKENEDVEDGEMENAEAEEKKKLGELEMEKLKKMKLKEKKNDLSDEEKELEKKNALENFEKLSKANKGAVKVQINTFGVEEGKRRYGAI